MRERFLHINCEFLANTLCVCVGVHVCANYAILEHLRPLRPKDFGNSNTNHAFSTGGDEPQQACLSKLCEGLFGYIKLLAYNGQLTGQNSD